MNHRLLGALLGLLSLVQAGCAAKATGPRPAAPTGVVRQTDPRARLREVLQGLSDESSDPLFRRHFQSILEVIAAGDRHSSASLKKLSRAFDDPSAVDSPRLRDSYLSRARPLIVSWVSPSDGQVSFAWLHLPANWDREREYPLYVQLHGLWDVAGERLKYLAHPFLNRATGPGPAFEDGYLVSPWGRGNRWYRGVAEKDIWECLATIKGLVRVDARRQYLCGFSMGGYGAWHIALGSPDAWAAIGIHAGALWRDGQRDVRPAAATALRNVPTYFVVGDSDGLLAVNVLACQLLLDAGNPHLAIVTFRGGHEYRNQDVERMYRWMRQFAREPRLAARED